MSIRVNNFSNIQNQQQADSMSNANQFSEKMKEERAEAFKNMLDHSKASLMINKSKMFSELSKMINNN